MTRLTGEQLAFWREREAERQQDAAHLAHNQQRDERRRAVRAEMLPFLADFLDERISLKAFKDTFDKKTRKEWDVFGLKGMSGAMFLNTLVKHMPDQATVADQLRRVLPVPSEVTEGRARLQAFYDFLVEAVQRGDVSRSQVQPVRAMFFVSGWWHVQQPEAWPAYYISGRRALDGAGLVTDSGDPVADYFTNRDVFLALKEDLGASAWEVEHLLVWHNEHPKADEGESPRPTTDHGPQPELQPGPEPIGVAEEAPASVAESSAHTRVQWQLAKLGAALNCQVWIASNDHSRSHNGQRLGELSVAALPNLGMDDDTRGIISLIDVIWLRGKKVVAAFEIESTTSIFSGILRLSDLLAVAPNVSFPLYLVVPAERAAAVRKQLCRETFRALDLPDRCRYFTFEDLGGHFEPMSQWATGPEAVRKLAQRVECGG